MACDFIPAPCEATRIANCVVKRGCSVEALSLPGMTLGMDKTLTGFRDLHLRIASLNARFIAAMIQAFVQSNCTLPPLPEFPDAPDFEDCLEQLEDLTAEGADPLGILSSVINVTFGTNGLPIQISNP
jgi:hypothetical protein